MAEPTVARILIVEDDSHISRIIQLSMPELDLPHSVDTALSAEEGLELWRAQPYDLLLTDYNLRGMNGLKLIATLKAEHYTAPMILFTAYDTPQIAREARAVGVAAYLPKPFFMDDMLAVIRANLPHVERTAGG
jgi:two-component system OmpR family response regulator